MPVSISFHQDEQDVILRSTANPDLHFGSISKKILKKPKTETERQQSIFIFITVKSCSAWYTVAGQKL